MKKLSLILSMVFAAFLFVVAFAPAAEAGRPGPSIVDIVLANPDIDEDGEGDFDTLLAAVQLADPSVLATLADNGQNTVFAPTDAAFDAAFAELATLGIDPNDVLTNQALLTLILEYHIAPGRQASTSVLNKQQIRMLDGGFLAQDGGVLTDNLGRTATIIAPDVAASNGVIHVIDNVVLPGLP